MRRIRRKNNTEEVRQRIPQSRVRQLVTHPPPFRDRDNEAASAQAGKMIRQALPAHADQLGQIARIRRSVTQRQKNSRPRGIRKCIPELCKN